MSVEQLDARPLPPDLPLGTYRPVLPGRGAGRRLRSLAGVREEILDWVPEERPRYTRLGAIVLNTGLLAGVSLLVALASLVDTSWVVMVPAAAVWAYVIVTFDGWLIASTHGVFTTGKARIFVPRLVISLLMGAVIAEPLLLWVFQPAIHKEVLDFRQDELTAYESRWRTCNPANGEFVTTAECARYHVNIKDSPQAAQQELAKATADRDRLKALVDELNTKREGLEKIARDECGGVKGPGLSGVVGNGSECKRNRAIADQFRTDSRLNKHQSDLAALNDRIDTLTKGVATAQQTAGTQISAAIDEKVTGMRGNQGRIGILDEDDALGRLSDRSWFVFVAQWLVRLLLIAIDCMPVLTKLMSNSTKYDLLVSRQVETAGRLHDKHVGLRERQDICGMDVQLQRVEQSLRTRIESIDEADRAARAQHEADQDAEIDALAAKLRRD